METIELKPTAEAYIAMLKLIAENSTNPEDRRWARSEVAKLEAQQ